MNSRSFLLSTITVASLLVEDAHAQSAPKRQGADVVIRCVDEASEYLKTGLFMALGVDRETVLNPPKFSTGVSEERRREIINEVYQDKPSSYTTYAKRAFVRCASGDGALFADETLEYCFTRFQVPLVEIYIAKDGGVPEQEVLSNWNKNPSVSDHPSLRRWGNNTIRRIYEGNATLSQAAWANFLGCAAYKEHPINER